MYKLWTFIYKSIHTHIFFNFINNYIQLLFSSHLILNSIVKIVHNNISYICEVLMSTSLRIQNGYSEVLRGID